MRKQRPKLPLPACLNGELAVPENHAARLITLLQKNKYGAIGVKYKD
jgi:hypothetical protein